MADAVARLIAQPAYSNATVRVLVNRNNRLDLPGSVLQFPFRDRFIALVHFTVIFNCEQYLRAVVECMDKRMCSQALASFHIHLLVAMTGMDCANECIKLSSEVTIDNESNEKIRKLSVRNDEGAVENYESCLSLTSIIAADDELERNEAFHDIPRDIPVVVDDQDEAKAPQSLTHTDTMGALTERARIFSEINIFGSHVPNCVINDLAEEVSRRNPKYGLPEETTSSGRKAIQRRRESIGSPQQAHSQEQKDLDAKPSNRLRRSNVLCPGTSKSLTNSAAKRRSSRRRRSSLSNGSVTRAGEVSNDSDASGKYLYAAEGSISVDCGSQKTGRNSVLLRRLRLRKSIGAFGFLDTSRLSACYSGEAVSGEFIFERIDDVFAKLNPGVSHDNQKEGATPIDLMASNTLDRKDVQIGSVSDPKMGLDDSATASRLPIKVSLAAQVDRIVNETEREDPFPLENFCEKEAFPKGRCAMMQRKQSRKAKSCSSLPRRSSKTDSEQIKPLLTKSIPPSQWPCLPLASSHQSAVLFVDISGFTRLSTELSPESLSKTVNSYFELIVSQVHAHGGDILKFAGDAIFVEWKASSLSGSSPQQLFHSPKMTFIECVKAAALCGADIVEKGSNFPAYNEKGSMSVQVATLNVHCGIGVGELVGMHLGDDEVRREYLFLGDPISQVAKAADGALLGEVAASPQALMTLRKTCNFGPEILNAPAGSPAVIASKSQRYFIPKSRNTLSKVEVTQRKLGAIISQGLEANNWKLKSSKELLKLLSLYVHPVLSKDCKILQEAQYKAGGLLADPELRSVYVMFIMPFISVRVTGIDEADTKLYNLLNDVINLVGRELQRFEGHLRQFIVDDKGLVMIATFGLKGSTFPNMVATRALPATIVIHNALQDELGVQNRIGATIGDAYCGVVGGTRRHEYSVMGRSVNLAARLMCSSLNPGILVDDAVRVTADRSYGFNALPPVEAKGYPDPVPIYEPLSPLERSWGRVQPHFVGRKMEIKAIWQMAKEIAMSNCPSKLIHLSGDIGVGKTTLTVHAIEHITKRMDATNSRLLVTRHASNESDLLLPFGLVGSVLIDALAFYSQSTSLDGGEDFRRNSLGNDLINPAGEFSQAEDSDFAQYLNLFESICVKLNAPSAFQQWVGHTLLGVPMNNSVVEPQQLADLAKEQNSLIKYLADVLIWCTRDASLVIMALDDVHHLDEVSWKIIEELFHSASNMLMICMSLSLSNFPSSISSSFLEQLDQQYTDEGRYLSINLGCLNENEIKVMIAKSLGLLDKDVADALKRNVLMTSGGNPHFANLILDMVKTGSMGKSESDTETAVYNSVGELILRRVDAFSPSVRLVLNVAAVFGSSFKLLEAVAILNQMVAPPQRPSVVVDKVKADLDVLVSEGVLRFVYEGFENGDEEDGICAFPCGLPSVPLDDDWELQDLTYNFSHGMWRSTTLKLMLDSRKRDIHRIIAHTMETYIDKHSCDYLTRVNLFGHLKACGESTKAASLALYIGKSFENLGLHDQAIKIYNDSLAMWRDEDTEGAIGGFYSDMIASLTIEELEIVIALLEALGSNLSKVDKPDANEEAHRMAIQLRAHVAERSRIP